MTPMDIAYKRGLDSILAHPPVGLASADELLSGPARRSWESVFSRSVSYRWLNEERTQRYTAITARYCQYLTRLKCQLQSRGIDFDTYRAGGAPSFGLGGTMPVISEHDFADYRLQLQHQMAYGHQDPFHPGRYYTLRPVDIERFRWFMESSFIPSLAGTGPVDTRLGYPQIFAHNVGPGGTRATKRPGENDGPPHNKRGRQQ